MDACDILIDMRNMRDCIHDAEKNGRAIGHFNCAELTVFNAAVAAAKKEGVPVIIGMSESEREFFGLRNSVALRDAWQKEGIAIFLNADHTKSFEKAREAIQAGFDAVLFDGSSLPMEENIRETRRVADYARMVRASGHRDIIIEGEIGYIGSGSKMRSRAPDGIQKTTPEEAVRFVKETGVDMLAPAVGNIHGIIKAGEPRLDIQRIAAIAKALRKHINRPIPLVLHGASGNSDKDIRAAVKAGMAIVHISTEIRVAWHAALEQSLRENPEELAPYALLHGAEQAAREIMIKKIRLIR